MPKPRVIPTNRGAQQLCEVKNSLTEIAAAIGCKSVGTITDYRKGRRKPAAELRETFQRVYSINSAAWDEPLAPAESSVTEPAAATPLGTTREEVEAQLVRARAVAQHPDITPSTAARIGAEIRGLLRLRAQLDAAEPVTLHRLASHELYQDVVRKVTEAVGDCDACANAILRALA